MNAQVTNMAIMFGAMQVAKRIPMDQPEILMYVRIAYVTSQLASLVLFFWISQQIKKKNDLTVLKYVEPKSPMSQEPGQLVTTTHKDYDLTETSKAMRGVLIGVLMVGFMHLYLGYTNPLVIQAILPFKNALESKPAQLYLWKKPATGDLKRPFKAGGLFGNTSDPATDKASIKEAEKAGGKKDE